MYPLSESDLDGYDRSDPKRGILERRRLGGDSLGGRLSGRDDERTIAAGEKTSSVLIERQETVPSAEPDLSPRETEGSGPTALPSDRCGRGNMHGLDCSKPRGHSGRCAF